MIFRCLISLIILSISLIILSISLIILTISLIILSISLIILSIRTRLSIITWTFGDFTWTNIVWPTCYSDNSSAKNWNFPHVRPDFVPFKRTSEYIWCGFSSQLIAYFLCNLQWHDIKTFYSEFRVLILDDFMASKSWFSRHSRYKLVAGIISVYWKHEVRL